MKNLFRLAIALLTIFLTLGCGLDSTTSSETSKITDSTTVSDDLTTSESSSATSEEVSTTTETSTTQTTSETMDQTTATQTTTVTTTSQTITENTSSQTTITTTTQATTTTAESTTTTETTTVNMVTIFFESGLGSSVSSITAIAGETISQPNDPTREGYEFAGWYLDLSFTQAYQFNVMPSSDITLYAKWIEVITPTGELLSILVDYDFVCTSSQCVYEVASGYNYIFDIDKLEFIYDKNVEDNSEGGYRILESRITVDTDWDVTYTYDLDENYGVQITTKLNLSGNAISGNYRVTYFSSNTHSESARKEEAIQDIGYFITFINSILNSAEISMDDLV